jgi:GntR family transcriptional regulator
MKRYFDVAQAEILSGKRKCGETINKRKEGLSLYSHVESLIRNKVLRGQLEPGEGLPKEEGLAQQFGVSKITIRKALSHLAQEGLIVRRPGKGTFVAENIPIKKQFVMTGGVREIVQDAARYQVKALGVEKVKVRETRIARDVKNFLHLNNNDTIGVIRRVRLLDGTPIYFLENFIPIDIANNLTMKDLSTKPLLKILKEKIGLVIGRGEMFLEAVPADDDIAEILEFEPFDPLILMQLYYWFESGAPLEIVNIFMRPDYFKYKVNIDAKGFENI